MAVDSKRASGARTSLVLLLLCAAAALPARALDIVPIYESPVTSATNAASIENAFQYACDQIEGMFTNPITITIAVTSVSGTSTLGESQEEFTNSYTYAQVKSALTSDTYFNSITTLPNTDPTNGGTFLITDPEAMALGLPAISTTNGIFTFGAGYDFDFDSSDRAVPDEVDFIGVAEHEITEIMGRSKFNNGAYYEPYDLFRYSAPGDPSPGITGSNIYFSINDGTTNLDTYNAIGNGGDLQDWAATNPYTADSYNAFSQAGYENGIDSIADMTAMEVLGYIPVPEPRIYALAAVGGLVILRAARKRPRPQR